MKEYNIISYISDKDFNMSVKELVNPIIRYGARGILLDDNNQVAIINKKVKNEYKLPGGGIEDGETKEEAFLREIYEETGCLAEIIDFLGITIEEKNKNNFKQVSYVFVAKVLKNTSKLHLTEKEKNEKTEVLWTNLNDGLNLIKNSEKELMGSIYDDLYKSLFMVRRDTQILEYYCNYYKELSN